MSLVVDASVALSWYLDDEQDADALAILARVRANGAVVPSLWRLEIANVLLLKLRRGRLSPQAFRIAIGELDELAIEVDAHTDEQAFGETIQLAQRHGLTAYDAAYLELAQRRGLALATLDRELRAAAQSAGLVTMA